PGADLAADTKVTVTVEATDEAGNKGSIAIEKEYGVDVNAPDAPTDLELNDDGTGLTGKGEPGSEIVVTDKDGNIIGTGTVDENGDFVVPVSPALTDGNTADVIAKDEAGNESDPVEITGEKDTIAPDAPTDLEISE